MHKNLLIIGCGDLGRYVAEAASRFDFNIFGLRRDITKIKDHKINLIEADILSANIPKIFFKKNFDYVVFCVTPDRFSQSDYYNTYYLGLQSVLTWLIKSKQNIKRFLFISSTSVYSQNDGSFVNEFSPTEPKNFSGKILLASEKLILSSCYPTSIIRLSGLYGLGRDRLIKKIQHGYFVDPKSKCYTNRIFIEDAASLIQSIIIQDSLGRTIEKVYIGVDDKPEQVYVVYNWLRMKLGIVDKIEELVFLRNKSKRCSNCLAKKLGWKPVYQSYKDGYKRILEYAGYNLK